MVTTATKAGKQKSQKVKNGRNAPSKKQALSVQREAFVTSREMDFFSGKELVNQTGHAVDEWPFVIVKELIDNAIDACEDLDISPEITVMANECGISVSDNGPGLPESTLEGTLNFSVRVSSREAYVSPDRGAQGNALKTLAAMPYVLDPDNGRFVVDTCGTRHEIRVFADPVSQRPKVRDEPSQSRSTGTTIGIQWEPTEDDFGPVWPFEDLNPCHQSKWDVTPFSEQFRLLIEGFAIFNPHATITLNWFGESHTWQATVPDWAKWKPSRLTSPHWYGTEHLERLIAAYVTLDRDAGNQPRTVGEFLKIFDGLAGSANRGKVLEDAGMHRMRLEDFARESGLDRDAIDRLLSAMKTHTKTIKPQRLGVIGEDHFKARLIEMGIVEDSFEYRKKLNTDGDGLPYVIETAFGWRGDESEEARLIHAAANWSSSISNPFRKFGSTGEGLEALLRELWAGQSEPIVYCVHLAHPRVRYTDRGKTSLAIK